MKKVCFFFLAAASFGLSAPSMAQQAPDLRTQATEVTRKLAQQISLDDARTVQVRRLTYSRLVQENEVTRMYADDPAMLQNKLRVVGDDYTEKLRGILSEQQFQRYTAFVPGAAAVPSTASTPAPSRP